MPKISEKKLAFPDQGSSTSSIECLHLAQSSLQKTPLTLVAHERKGSLVAGRRIG